MLPEDRSIMGEPRDRSRAVLEASENGTADAAADDAPVAAPAGGEAVTVARGAALPAEPEDAPASSKRDWL